MNHEDSPKKRKTVKIHLQPKPAAPRHPYVVARAVALPNPVHSSQKKRSCFVFPMVQVTVASFLGIMTLDFGECSHVVAYAALGYLGGLLMMAPRRYALTATDEMLIRWGFIILFFVSSLISAIIWPLRMRGM